MPTLITSPPRVKLDGAALSQGLADRLVGLEVLLSTREPGRATMRLLDRDYELLDSEDFSGLVIGTPVTVALAEGEATTTVVFDGEITAIGVEQSEGGLDSEVVVEAQDGSHRLATAAHPTTWLHTSTAGVVAAIADRHGLTPQIDGRAATATTHPWLAQSGTDHAMLDDLAHHIGFEWWTHGRELHFKQRRSRAPVRTLKRGEDLVAVSVRYDGRDTPKSVQVTGWDSAATQAIVGRAPTLGRSELEVALGSSAPFVTDQHEAAKKAFGTALSVGEVTTLDTAEAEVLAGSVERELLADGLRVQATLTGDPGIRAGEWVRLEQLGTALSGDYYVTEVRHRFGPGEDLMTELVGAERRPEPGVRRPERVTPGGGPWTMRGPVPAIVTNVADPQDLGRVKVKFPTLDDSLESTWARVVAPGAGTDRGLDLRPRVDDEVLVAFQHGDQRQAYVLGGLWSEQHRHADPEAFDGDVHTRDALRSQTGGVLTLHGGEEKDDDPGHQHPAAWRDEKPDLKGAMSLCSTTGAGVLVADAVVVSTQDKDIVITNGKATIRLRASGDIEIEGESLAVKTKQKATVAVTSGDASIEATNVKLKGKSGAEVDATKTTVKSMGGIKLQSMKVEMGP